MSGVGKSSKLQKGKEIVSSENPTDAKLKESGLLSSLDSESSQNPNLKSGSGSKFGRSKEPGSPSLGSSSLESNFDSRSNSKSSSGSRSSSGSGLESKSNWSGLIYATNEYIDTQNEQPILVNTNIEEPELKNESEHEGPVEDIGLINVGTSSAARAMSTKKLPPLSLRKLQKILNM